jgi:cell division protein FtsX
MAASDGRQRWVTGTLGAAAGAVVGFSLSWLIYTALNPVLEASTGWTRELQGFLWNVVPLLTLAGAVVGALVAVRWRRRGRAGPR